MSQCKHAEHALADTRRVSRDSPGTPPCQQAVVVGRSRAGWRPRSQQRHLPNPLCRCSGGGAPLLLGSAQPLRRPATAGEAWRRLRCRRLRDWLRQLQRWGVRHRLSLAQRAPLLAAGKQPAPLNSLTLAARRSPTDAAPPATRQPQRFWLEVPLQSLVMLPAGAALVEVLPPTAAMLLAPRTQPAAEVPSAEPLRCLRPAGLTAALHRLACRSAGNASCAAESDCSTTSRQCTLGFTAAC